MTDNYKVDYSRRKSVTLVIKDGQLFVKAPVGVGKQRIESFIESKKEWIQKKIDRYRAIKSNTQKLLDGSIFLLLGKELQILFYEKKKITIKSDLSGLMLPEKFKEESEIRNCEIYKWYKKFAAVYFKERVSQYILQYGYTVKYVKLTNAKGNWGSCTKDHVLRFNWRLLFLPEKLIEYVIVHELSHTIEHNHSKSFWFEVEKRLPDYKQIRKELKNNFILMEIYR